jgi:hypothetical protein
MPGRTWIIAPDKGTLEDRWERLIKEKDEKKREELFQPHEGGDKTSTKGSKVGLAGHEFRSQSSRATAALTGMFASTFRSLKAASPPPADNGNSNRPTTLGSLVGQFK